MSDEYSTLLLRQFARHIGIDKTGRNIVDGDGARTDLARECMAAAYDAGVNFFDNAEIYAKGQSETIMGEVVKKLGWRRSSYLISSANFASSTGVCAHR